MDKMRMETLNLTARNVEKIAALFPNCVTEALDGERSTKDCKVYKKVVNFELLRQMLSDEVIEGDEAYEFTWVGKKAAVVEAHKPIRKTLRPCPEESVNWDTTENLYIEGDNLEVLKLLQESYLGKVKMIYIDPPYNTGHDFVYPDSFIMDNEEYNAGTGYFDEDGNVNFSRENSTAAGKYHSDWCSMMYSRLLLARDLLTDDGVIFISIDDNEQDNLKKMCNEILGEENHVETVIWKNKYGAGAKTVGFISAHEYILIYSKKRISNITCEFEGEEREKYNKKDNKYNVRGPYRTQPLMTNSLGDRPNLMYSIFYQGIEIKPKKQWVWSKERLEAAIANDDVEFNLQRDGTYTVRSKAYLYDENGNTRRGKPVSILNGPFTQDGTREMRALFEDKSIFDFTKPSKLIEYLINLEVNDICDNDFVVLDFFSGSATTAQSVMQQNLKDGGHRKFIMVQLPEPTAEKSEAFKAGYKNICEIGKERIRRAGKKILEENADKEGIDKLDVGFRVLKLDDSNMNDVYYAAGDYTQDLLLNMESNIKDDRTDLDLLFGCLLEWGLPLSLPYTSETIEGATVHTYNDGDLVACFDENISDAAIKAIAKKKPLRAVFRDSSFADSPAKINVGEIFKMLSPDTRVKVI